MSVCSLLVTLDILNSTEGSKVPDEMYSSSWNLDLYVSYFMLFVTFLIHQRRDIYTTVRILFHGFLNT